MEQNDYFEMEQGSYFEKIYKSYKIILTNDIKEDYSNE